MLVNNNYPEELVDGEIKKFIAKILDDNIKDIKMINSIINIYYENQMKKKILKR